MTHYFSQQPQGPLTFKKLHAHVRGLSFSFFTASGIFSSRKLDDGTCALLCFINILPQDRVLDLGCGNGVVGLVASKFTKGLVTLTDINERAILVAQMNQKLFGSLNVEVFQGDGYAPLQEKKFHVILFNPPQTAGKKLCFLLLEQAREHLLPQGTLQVVCRLKKGGKSFEQKMFEVFGNVEVIGKQKGYAVFLMSFIGLSCLLS